MRRTIRQRAGFTVIELLMTIAVFSVLVMAAMPRFSEFQRSLAMKSNARNLATNFRLAQQKAASANRRAFMDFDVSQRFMTIWLDKDMDANYDGNEEVEAVGFIYEDNQGGVPGVRLPENTSFESTTFPNGPRGFPSVTFTSDGGVTNAGEIVLKDDWGRRYKVEVTAAGSISILQKVGSTWKE